MQREGDREEGGNLRVGRAKETEALILVDVQFIAELEDLYREINVGKEKQSKEWKIGTHHFSIGLIEGQTFPLDYDLVICSEVMSVCGILALHHKSN